MHQKATQPMEFNHEATQTTSGDVIRSVMAATQRVGIQLRRARWQKPPKTYDLAREAVSCNHPSDTPYVGTEGTLGEFLSNHPPGAPSVKDGRNCPHQRR